MHEKVETFSKFATHKKIEWIRTSYAAAFFKDELQQMMKIMAACTFISLSRFCLSLTGFVVCAREECVAMAEMTWSLLVDLVFNDAATISEP